jgi:hypothetical protein
MPPALQPCLLVPLARLSCAARSTWSRLLQERAGSVMSVQQAHALTDHQQGFRILNRALPFLL